MRARSLQRRHRWTAPSRAATASVCAYPQMTTLNFRSEDAHRLVSGRRQRFPRPQAKAGAVTRTDNFRSLDGAAGQFRAVVSADIFEGKIRLAAACDGDHQ